MCKHTLLDGPGCIGWRMKEAFSVVSHHQKGEMLFFLSHAPYDSGQEVCRLQTNLHMSISSGSYWARLFVQYLRIHWSGPLESGKIYLSISYVSCFLILWNLEPVSLRDYLMEEINMNRRLSFLPILFWNSKKYSDRTSDLENQVLTRSLDHSERWSFNFQLSGWKVKHVALKFPSYYARYWSSTPLCTSYQKWFDSEIAFLGLF